MFGSNHDSNMEKYEVNKLQKLINMRVCNMNYRVIY